MLNTTPTTPGRLDARAGRSERTGPVGRVVRLLLAVGFAYGFATLVDQGGPASVRDPETLTSDAPFAVLTIAMVAAYAVLVGELAKIIAGEAVAKIARSAALGVLGAAAAVAVLVGEVRAGAVWGSPLSDLVWTLDVAMLGQTIVALLLAVALGTRGCEIGVWGDIAARLRSEPASPPICMIGLHHLDEWEARRRGEAHRDDGPRSGASLRSQSMAKKESGVTQGQSGRRP